MAQSTIAITKMKSSSLLQLAHRARHLSTAVQAKMTGTDISKVPDVARSFIEETVALCRPDVVHICNGTKEEETALQAAMMEQGLAEPLKLDNCFLTRTDPADVARVESKTVICTEQQRQAIPTPVDGVKGTLGKWISPDDLNKAKAERFPGSMKGRTMYVLPFSMGPIGSPLSKVGVELTDSPYVAASMRIMTRLGSDVWNHVDDKLIRCLHSVGRPLPYTGSSKYAWPCNPKNTIIAHVPSEKRILSYGSGYGGNSLLGKKCFALRIGSTLAHTEGWLAEHMLILGITNPQGKKTYVVGAFPSACGKTNLAMMKPTLPGFKVECVGDDIAWMRFDENGQLRAINPEAGFFGVAPGTSDATNPMAMATIKQNTLYTNVAKTSDGGVFWEGLEKERDISKLSVTSWLNEPWTPDSGKLSSHANSRFCTPATGCPIMDDDWESPRGVPISAILFGGRRPQGVPLVYESRSWRHGVFVGACMRSEATAAAEHGGKMIMHDPFAMRPFFGYNFGDYLKHWLSVEKENRQMPKIFHVNWFRKGADGKFLWPGFGENSRVLDWVIRRVSGEDSGKETAIGIVPKPGAINTKGLGELDMEELFRMDKGFWQEETKAMDKYFSEQLPKDLPDEIGAELSGLKKRVSEM